MKNLLALLLLIVMGSLMDAQSAAFIPTTLTESGREAVPDKITSGLYALADISENNVLFNGSTTHFSNVTFRLETLNKRDGNQQLRLNEEQILIMKEGEATVRLGKKTKTIGPNSVFFLLPGEAGSITARSPSVTYYRMVYTTVQSIRSESQNQDISSFIIDHDELPFHKSEKGGTHKYFNRSTAMLPYYEMHVTTLNPGIQSHPPHTHEAAEIILIIEGETEEEIDGKIYRGQEGDVYFLASNIPHAIKNIGDQPCRYFAFQWGKER